MEHSRADMWVYRAQGAVAGAVIALFALPYGAGWYTAGGAKAHSELAAMNAVLPYCVKDVMADPTAVAELKVKRTSDYDDVVRDHVKRIDPKADSNYPFWRACGKLLEGKVVRTAS